MKALSKAEIRKDKRLRQTYGLTLKQFKLLYALQKGRCAICQRAFGDLKPNVDHDHRDKNVRGLLCFFCNKYRVGRAHTEHAGLFRRVAVYLELNLDARTL